MLQEGLFSRSDNSSSVPLAEISSDHQYRYFLSRQWEPTLPAIAFIGLNPSTADAFEDDPTIRRCISFAKTWGGGSLWMVNLFAFRSTDPLALRDAKDPVGPSNDEWIDFAVRRAGSVVAAWGNYGTLFGRAEIITSRHGLNLKALQITKSGMPKHPLYVRGDTAPSAYQAEISSTRTR